MVKVKLFKNMASNMRFLITGGLGFIGSNFILNTFQKFPDSNNVQYTIVSLIMSIFFVN